MATVKHPHLTNVTRDVPDKDLADWLEQGWRAVDDGAPSSFKALTADGGEGAKPKPGPRDKP